MATNADFKYSSDSEMMAAFAIVDGRTGADFRAIRESIGWTQAEVAKALNVDKSVIQKWETPQAGWDVRPYGWAWADRMRKAFLAEVDELIDVALDEIERQGIEEGGTVKISYYRNGRVREGVARTRNGEPAGAADTVSRAVGEYLEDEGYKVRYVWAEEGGWIV